MLAVGTVSHVTNYNDDITNHTDYGDHISTLCQN